MKNKFNFYDVVKIASNKLSLRKINGAEGVIKGMAQNEETGKWGYAVSVEKDGGLGWDIMEEDLEPTGKKASPPDPKTVETIKVRVDRQTGKGEIVDEN